MVELQRNLLVAASDAPLLGLVTPVAPKMSGCPVLGAAAYVCAFGYDSVHIVSHK